MTRRSLRLGPVMVVALLGAVVASPARPGDSRAATFVAEPDARSLLERPMFDVAMLPPGADPSRPRLLVMDAVRPTPGAVRLSIIARTGEWSEVASAEVALQPADAGAVRPERALDAPWLLPIDDRAVLVIANASVDGAAYVTRVDVVADGVDGDRLVQGPIARLPIPVDDAGIADVHGDGRPSLVVASARTVRGRGTCQGSTLLVVEPWRLTTTATLTVRDMRVAGGVLGRFDGAPGDDLLAYAYPNCPAGPDTTDEALAVMISLLDGSVTWSTPAAPVPGFLGSPLLIPRPDQARDDVVVRGRGALVHLGWRGTWTETPVADASSAPLAAVASPGPPGAPGSATIAWLQDARTDPSISVARLVDGTVTSGALPSADIGMERWARIVAADVDGSRAGSPPVAFPMVSDDAGCPDLFLAGAVVPCGSQAPRAAASWSATRPLAVTGTGQSARLLVAAGIGWEDRPSPGVPSPAATGVPGWWRHGPSVPFVLNEAHAADAMYFRRFPVPAITIEPTAGPGDRVDLAGFTGTRLFIRIAAAGVEVGEAPTVRVEDVLQADDGDADDRRLVARVPVPAGVETGRDGGIVSVRLGPAGPAPVRWIMTVVPINDWGEMGRAVAGLVVRDTQAPYLDVAAPFTTPVWPAVAELGGTAEPGASVRIDDAPPRSIDRRGRFTFQATLVPWPQTFRVTATDAAGNVTARDVTIVGGIDYRQVPLEAVLATLLLIAAVARGLFGADRRRATTAVDIPRPERDSSDDWPGPELVELPSGVEGNGRR